MKNLIIKKATYYDPHQGYQEGTDVAEELSAEIKNNTLIYEGEYNDIFPDKFKKIKKKLRIELVYNGQQYIRFYSESQKINIPEDLGLTKKRAVNIFNPYFVGCVFLIAGLILSILIKQPDFLYKQKNQGGADIVFPETKVNIQRDGDDIILEPVVVNVGGYDAENIESVCYQMLSKTEGEFSGNEKIFKCFDTELPNKLPPGDEMKFAKQRFKDASGRLVTLILHLDFIDALTGEGKHNTVIYKYYIGESEVRTLPTNVRDYFIFYNKLEEAIENNQITNEYLIQYILENKPPANKTYFELIK